MENVSCNIDTTDKVHRIAVGIILLLGMLFGLGRGFVMIIATIMIVEGYLGKCGIPYLIAKYHELMAKK